MNTKRLRINSVIPILTALVGFGTQTALADVVPQIVGISIPVDSMDAPCRPLDDGVWSIQAGPCEDINVDLGIGHLIYPDPGSFVLHDHQYVGSNVPDPARAVVTYEFNTPIVVDQIELRQHANGISRIEGFVGDSLASLVSVGSVFGPGGDVTGNAVFGEGEITIFDFDNVIAGRYFRFIIRKTPLSDGYAAYQAYPRDSNGQRFSPQAATQSFYRDADGDGLGDPYDYVRACEAPSGFVTNGTDNCPTFANLGQEDADADGVGDACDPFNGCTPLPSGAIAWWRAEGDATDFVDGNHGTPINGATFASGIVSQAFSFDGSDDYVSVPDSPAWAFGLTDFTIELWVNLDVFRSGPPSFPGQILIGHDEGGGNTNKWAFYPADGLLVFHINTPSGGPLFLTGPFAMSASRWYHLAVTRSGSTFTFFADGVSVGTASSTRAVPDANAPLTIGRAEGFFTDGRLDETTIYSRALSAPEIAAIYVAGSLGKCIIPDTDNDTIADNDDNCPTIANADQLDFDNDTIGDACDPDDDNDGLSDVDEASYATNPFNTDSDTDGLTDGDEVHTYTTNPVNPDTDADNLLDGQEVALQTFGNCPSPLLADTDDDGLDDYIETVIIPALDPCDADCDDDGLADGVENQLGTSLCDADTDDDGLLDGTEVDMGCLSPFAADTDADTLTDGAEVTLGYNPCNPDTDADGARDDVDPSPLDPGVTSGFIEDWLRALAALPCPLHVIDAPNNNARQGRCNAMSNKLSSAANHVAHGNYQAAINELESLRQKLDGAPQPPDWMIPSAERNQLVADIDLTISWLEYLLP